MERKITIYANEQKNFDEIQLIYGALSNTKKLECLYIEPQKSTLGERLPFFYSGKNPVNNHSAKFKELRYRVADTYTEEDILNELADIVSSTSVPCIIEYSMSDNKALRWADFDKKNNDISGFYSAIKFSAPAREIIAAYQDILNMFDKEHKLLTNILIGFSGSELIEIRYEFETDPDFEVLLKDFLKKHPDIRVLSVTSSKKCTDQTVLVSGSGTHKFKTKKISYERCWDNDYNHLSSKFNLWGNPEFYEQDIYFKTNSQDSILSWINSFNWNKKIDFTAFPQGITTIGKKAFINNKYIEEIILPASLKKIEKEAFAKCSNLKHVYFNSEPDIEDDVFDSCKKLTVHANTGGKVEIYSQEKGIPFVAK